MGKVPQMLLDGRRVDIIDRQGLFGQHRAALRRHLGKPTTDKDAVLHRPAREYMDYAGSHVR